jgi:hypothetical protein
MLDLDVVDGGDRTDIALRLLPGVTVTGAISFDRAAEPPKDVTAVDLSFIALNAIPGLPATLRAIVAADGSFRVPSLAPGNYLVRAEVAGAAAISATGARWALKSAMAGSSDLADRPMTAVPGGSEVTGVVAMTARAGEIRPSSMQAICPSPAIQSWWSAPRRCGSRTAAACEPCSLRRMVRSSRRASAG